MNVNQLAGVINNIPKGLSILLVDDNSNETALEVENIILYQNKVLLSTRPVSLIES